MDNMKENNMVERIIFPLIVLANRGLIHSPLHWNLYTGYHNYCILELNKNQMKSKDIIFPQ